MFDIRQSLSEIDSKCDLFSNIPLSSILLSKPTSRLAHACQLDIDQVAQFCRQSCIVCTLGDCWNNIEGIEKMIKSGMNILLLNLSMTSRETCKSVIEVVRNIEESLNYCPSIGIAMDMTAAPVRTGLFKGVLNTEVILEEGSRVELTTDETFKNTCTASKIYIDTTYFPQLIQSVHKNDRISIDDGQICLIAKEFGYDSITCLVEDGGSIGGYKRVTLPRERLYQDSVKKNYIKDLAFAAECGVDFVFTSFSENAEMLNNARSFLPKTTKLFAKIETRESVRNLHSIIEASDGIIIRRSDLAVQYSSEKVFKIQKHIIGHCNIAQKPVFIIEQLLESMRTKPRPTRAESSDVANAVLDGADGFILTVETSWGIYPFECVTVVDQICREAEKAIFNDSLRAELKNCHQFQGLSKNQITHVTAASAVEAVASSNAKAIFVITSSGAAAMSIAAFKPPCITIGITRDVIVARHCHSYRGLYPFVYMGEKLENWSEDMDLRINAAIDFAKRQGFVVPLDTVVIVHGSLAGSGSTNTIQIFSVPLKEKRLKVVSSANSLLNLNNVQENLSERKFGGTFDLRVPL